MAKLFILAGIPGCGKSTFAKKVLSHANVVSSDEIRSRFGDVNDQTNNAQVFNIFHAEIAWNLAHDEDVIADSTALDRKSRLHLRLLATIMGAESHLVYFSNCDQAAVQNMARDRVVPQHVMDRMLDKYEKFLMDLPGEASHYTSITEIGSST